tara:strand:- start:43 stop:1230 length:1188 start_codon:yes stop_codon:yes gene_type:complete
MAAQFGSRSRIVAKGKPNVEATEAPQATPQATPQAAPQAASSPDTGGIEGMLRSLLSEFLGDRGQPTLPAAPSVTTAQLSPAMGTQAVQDAQEQAAIRSASGITESLGRPSPTAMTEVSGFTTNPQGDSGAGVTVGGVDAAIDRGPEQGLVSPPVAEAVPTREEFNTSLRPKLREEDNLVNKALKLNKGSSELSKDSVVDQVRSLVGKNDYAAGILGAFTKEAGSNFTSLEENTNYSLSNAKSVFSSSRIDGALKAVTVDVRKKIEAGGRDKAFGEALMSHYGGGGKYHGRGLIHITHDYNYKAVGDRIGVDLVANPELVKDPRYAVPAALAFLEMNDYFNPDKPITKDRLHGIVNRWSGQAIKDSRWKSVESFMEDNTPAETSVRPKSSEKKTN